MERKEMRPAVAGNISADMFVELKEVSEMLLLHRRKDANLKLSVAAKHNTNGGAPLRAPSEKHIVA
jgi:hypothetical protein